MSNNLTLTGSHKDFEAIKKIDGPGIEYWEARDLMTLLGYAKWSNFEEVVNKAIKACIQSGQAVENHFADISKIVRHL